MPGYEIIGKEERDAVNDVFDKVGAILEDGAQAVRGEYKEDKLALTAGYQNLLASITLHVFRARMHTKQLFMRASVSIS
jgi:hypothetical protein